MSCRTVVAVKAAVLSAAALLLMAPQGLAGVVHTGNQSKPQPAPVRAAASRPAVAPVTIAVSVAEAQESEKETASVNLRGPDGQLRRFAVEGGREALSSRIVVLRPGESVTVRLTVGK
jgi:hypothetical protein